MEINPLALRGVASILNVQFSNVFLVITFTGIFSAIAFMWIVRGPTYDNPDSKVHGVNMGPIWVLSAPDGPHVGPMNLVIREDNVGSGITRTNF